MAIGTRRPRARPWLRLLAIPALAIPALIGVTALWGLIAARSTPVVRAVTITLAGIPHGTRPLRIALVSDIHVGNWAMPVDRLNRIVDQINAERPDAVLIAGDMVNGGVPESPNFIPNCSLRRCRGCARRWARLPASATTMPRPIPNWSARPCAAPGCRCWLIARCGSGRSR